MKRSIYYFLTVFVFFLLFGVHSFFQENSKLSFHEESMPLRLCLRTEPIHVDPRKCSDGLTSQFLMFLYDGLTRFNPRGECEFSLAESVDILNKGKTYRFKIRKAEWSNGDSITAWDFENSWKMVLDADFPSYHPDYLFGILNAKKAYEKKCSLDEVGIKAIDAHIFEVQLEYEDPYFLELISDKTFFPIYHKLDKKNHAWSENHSKLSVFSGPFLIKKWKSQNKIILKKNPLYWDKDHVKIEAVELNIIEDEMTQLNLFENQELDWVGSPYSMLPMDALGKLQNQHLLHVFQAASISYYAFNINKPFLQNPKIRKALSYAISRQDLLHFISIGKDQPAMSLVPPSMHAVHGEYFKDGDIQYAQQLFKEGLEELNSDMSKLSPLVLSYPAIQSRHLMAQAIQHQWKKHLGLEVQLESKEWQVFLRDIARGHFQIAALSRGSHHLDPYYFLSHFDSKSRKSNPTGWEDEQFKQLLDKCQKTSDVVTRQKLCKEAEEIIMDQMPIAPLIFPSQYYLKSPKLVNIALHEVGRVDFKWAYFEEPD